MKGHEIRESFIRFFEGKGHLHQPSASLIPAGDPTLLFTSAGMVPLKPFFMGEQTPPSRRLTSYQKSFRTTDIDEVGDHKHLTFFEMLGNFSIGDYFKKDAVSFAWELVTELFHIPPERIFITIHLDDDEAYEIWRKDIGVPEERIYRYGDKDNWWGPAGTEGPTGPCSELHYDGGAEKGCGSMVTPDTLAELQRREITSGEPAPVCVASRHWSSPHDDRRGRDQTGAFLDRDRLIGVDVVDRVHLATGPGDPDGAEGGRGSEPERQR